MTLKAIWELKKIALRNLARHKVKTLLTCAAIMVSVAVFIFLKCWLGGMTIESRRNIVNFEIGAAKLQTKLYFEKKDEMPSYETFTGWEIYQAALDREGYNSAPRYVFSGMLYSLTGSAPILFHAVDPASEMKTLRYVPYVDFGRYPQNGEFEIALGHVAAEKLKIGIPSRPLRLELEELIAQAVSNQADAEFIRSLYETAPLKRDPFSPPEIHEAGNERLMLKKSASKNDLDRFWNMIAATGRNNVRITAVIDVKSETGAVYHINQLLDVTVTGVINSPAPLPNGNTAFIPLDVLQDDAGMMLEGAVTELIIRDANVSDAHLPGASESSAAITDALVRGLSSMGLSLPGELAVFTWQDLMEDYLGYEELQTSMPQILAFMLFILSFLGISNTILMAILERTKETGMMRAQGMTDSQIIITYMLEAGFIGFIGSILGIILGCIINYPVVKYGIDFSSMADVLSDGIGFRTTAIFRSVWDVPLIIGTGIVATLISSCMAFFPTRKAVKMPITDSLRFE
jgi:ABC-type lipoprotein release transport system permease subunit